MAETDDLIGAFEMHSVGEIQAVLDTGLNLEAPIQGKSPVNWLTEMYTRSADFPACLQLLLENGAELDDPVIAPVLLDDAESVAAMLRRDPSLIRHRTTMVSAFTPLVGASLLHVAAEFGNAKAARVLIEMGADLEAKAAQDENGMNGHTPIFHTVNSVVNYSEPILRMLIEAGAKCDVQLQGITWGKGFEWETTLFDVTPVSYAQFGLLPQVHRRERDIYAIVDLLLQASGRPVPPLDNVPNRYLQPRA
jgi:hypothetical protein